jgi:hypothetical protein
MHHPAVSGIVTAFLIALTPLAAGDAVLYAQRPAAAPPARTPAFGDYQFGMTRGEVRRIRACSPYQYVAGTGGLECPNLTLGTRTMNISFVFKGDALSRIQLWFYEGPTESAARKATDEMLDFMAKRGPIRSDELKGTRPTVDAIFRTLLQRNVDRQGARVQVLLPATTTPPFVHASVTRVLTGYYVFAFFTNENASR